MISRGTQDAIQEAIALAGPEKLLAMKNEAEAWAEILARQLQESDYRDSPDEVAEFERCIEILIRIEGTIKGYGFIWRAVRRVTLAREYLRE